MKIKSLVAACAVAMSAVAMSVPTVAQASEINIATGSYGGGYYRLGQEIKVNLKNQRKPLNSDVTETNGSIENIEMLNADEAQIIVAQADALAVNPPIVPVDGRSAYSEYVFWVANKDLDFTSLEDIEGSDKYKIAIVQDSGAVVTLQKFAQEDKDYAVNLDNAVFTTDLYDAAYYAAEGRKDDNIIAGFLYVGSRIPAEIGADFGKDLVIGEATDYDFNDAEDAVTGEPLYRTCEIKKDATPGIPTATFGKPDTVCVDSLVVYRKDLDRDAFRTIRKAVVQSTR